MRLDPMNSWFRAKTLGLGWTPARWEGWAVLMAVTLAIFVAGADSAR